MNCLDKCVVLFIALFCRCKNTINIPPKSRYNRSDRGQDDDYNDEADDDADDPPLEPATGTHMIVRENYISPEVLIENEHRTRQQLDNHLVLGIA